MRVYTAVLEIPYEGTEFVGVYLNLESAKIACNEHDYEIYEDCTPPGGNLEFSQYDPTEWISEDRPSGGYIIREVEPEDLTTSN